MKEPPPIIESTRVLHYVATGGAKTYTGRLTIYTGIKRFRELSPVPRLVIARQFTNDEILLMHCDQSWKVKAVTGAKSIAAAKLLGERAYRGVSGRWVRFRKLTIAESKHLALERRYLRELVKRHPGVEEVHAA